MNSIFRRLSASLIALSLVPWGPALAQNPGPPSLEIETATAAQALIGLEFDESEQELMLPKLKGNRASYERLRQFPIPNQALPSLRFDPLPPGWRAEERTHQNLWSPRPEPSGPVEMESLAFESIGQLAARLRSGQITSTALTEMYLERLKRFGPQLACVVTLTEERALAQARKADEEIAAGAYRGPLHGIPYGAKDLLAVEGYKTTWGAAPFKDQEIDETATVIERLDQAGAVLVAKLSLGALAWGDVWYGGKTRNPWNLEQGSSGSSAGSASATAAGLVGFSIGSETWGSIVSPSTRCGVTGLRPTFGRVSRAGAMALSWSMDKLGPICRTVEDCAMVLDAIRGSDAKDPTVVDAPFHFDATQDLQGLRVGYLEEAFDETNANDQATLATLRELGVDLIPFDLPDDPRIPSLSIILNAEAAAAFDDLTRSGRDSELVRQIENAWPNVFRASRFIPAVEYIQANRVRQMLIQEMDALFDSMDVYVAPTFGGNNLLITNLTGHPCVVTPNGFNENGSPTSISFIGALFHEEAALRLAKAYQDATEHHLAQPPLFAVEP